MITLDVDIAGCNDWLTDVGDRQLPFAASKMLNALALDVQAAERAHLRDIFTLRRPQWADRSIKITHFAKKTELWATVAVSPPGAPQKSDILGKFEDQTEKTPAQGGRSIVIPTADTKRTAGGIISRGMRPRALHFQRAKNSTGRGQYTVFVGDRETVLLQRPDGSGLIVQKNGPHKAGTRDGTVLYVLRPSVRIRPELHFKAIGERVVLARTAERWDEAAALALSTAR